MRRRFLSVALCMLLLPSIGWAAELQGLVLEEKSGQPIIATVSVYKQNIYGEWDYAGSRETDKTGAYSFTALDEGRYYVESRGYSPCDRKVEYCADKYLPQLYNNIAEWDFTHKTEIVLSQADVKKLDTIKIKTRPFYFATTPNPCEPAGSDGTVKITRKVFNTTNHQQYMLFWGVVDSPFRAEHSNYYGMQASYSFGQAKWVWLKPGSNTVTFTYRGTPTPIKGSYNYWIIGGNSDWLPMTPYLSGTFCYGVSAVQNTVDLSLEGNAVGTDNPRSLIKSIPTKISADGKVLERGLPDLQ